MASSPDPVTALDRPVSSLTLDAYTTLCFGLTMSQGLGGRNWEGIAGIVGFKTDQVMAMKKHSDDNKGRLFLTTWEKLNKSEATVKKLIFALQSLKMMDCIDALLKDPSISDEDIESAVNECEQLSRISSQFPSVYSTVDFCNALYNSAPAPYPYPYHGHSHVQHDPPFPRVAPPAIDEPGVIEETSQSASDIQHDSTSESHFEPNSIFISHYPCPKDGEQARHLDELTEYLRSYGYTVYYDKYFDREIQQCGGVGLWKEKHIRTAETILVICTPEYFEDDENATMKGGYSKIEVDRKLLRSIAYSRKCDRLIPVLLDEFKNVRNCIPTFVQPFALHFWPSKKQDLIFSIAKTPKYQLPEILPHEKKVVKSIVIKVPQRKEPPKPSRVQMAEGNDKKSKIVHSQEKKVLRSTVIKVSQPKEVPKSVLHESSNLLQSSKQKEVPMVQSQNTKKGPFRAFSKLKKVLKSK